MRRTVIFDFGAVLFQWQPVRLMMQALPGHAPDEARAQALAAQIFQSFVPGSDWARYDLGLLDADAVARRIAARSGLPLHDAQALVRAVPAHLHPLPDSVALFRALKAAGHRMVFLSNMPRPCAEHLERHNPFIAEFDDGIFSGRVGLIKPWPALFELASLRFGLAAHRHSALFIDDHAGNIDAGRAHGWQGLQFVDAAQARAALEEAGWI
jgi:putative hydrolase of the HAD superfamily